MATTTVTAPKKEQQSTGLTTVGEKIARIDIISRQCCLTTAPKSFGSALMVAQAMQELRQLLTGEIMKNLMALQGSELGFVTDRDKSKDGAKGYPEEVVRDVAIAAILRGFQMVNNEVNIIAGKFYGAKNGFIRLVRELPGLTDLKIEEGRVVKTDGGTVALVPLVVTWKLSGVADSLKCDIPVKMDQYSSIDQILGKAHRKILARIHSRVTGSKTLLDDVEKEEAVEGEFVDTVPEAAAFPEPEKAAAVQDNVKSQAAQEAVSQADNRDAAWMAYCKGVQESETAAAVDMIYDTCFGPERVIGWEPVDDQNAATIRDGRKAALRAAKSAT